MTNGYRFINMAQYTSVGHPSFESSVIFELFNPQGEYERIRLQELLDLINTQYERIQSLESLYPELMKEGDFDILLNIMQDNNLTWNRVCNIITEALTDE